MLDSLVRVSRRVKGTANLLATEMQPVPVRDTCYTRLLRYPPAPKLETRGLAERIKLNFTQALSPALVVRCVNGGRNAATEKELAETPSHR